MCIWVQPTRMRLEVMTTQRPPRCNNRKVQVASPSPVHPQRRENKRLVGPPAPGNARVSTCMRVSHARAARKSNVIWAHARSAQRWRRGKTMLSFAILTHPKTTKNDGTNFSKAQSIQRRQRTMAEPKVGVYALVLRIKLNALHQHNVTFNVNSK